jgi:hypothetical protein
MTRNALRERSHRHDYYSFNRWVALMRDALTGLREALKGGSLAAFIVRNRIRRGSLLELDSILASLALEVGFRSRRCILPLLLRASGSTSSPRRA